MNISVILPARNESATIKELLLRLQAMDIADEIIVVDDGSNDQTAELAGRVATRVIRHPYAMGNGAAIKTGARAASGDILIFMDADGQHCPEDIPLLLAKLNDNMDMCVGARMDKRFHATIFRAMANRFYNRFASWMVGHRISDLTSGFRAVKADYFKQFIPLLPNSFSYPTTITMCFFRAGFAVSYVPVAMPKRDKTTSSHINPFKDGVRFLLIIFKVGMLFSPLKIFIPVALLFALSATFYYGFTFFTQHRLTNMTVILYINAIIIFLIGLVSEQITTLLYMGVGRRQK